MATGAKRVVVLCVVILVFLPVGVFGHSYLAEPGAGAVTLIPDIGVSRAAYRELKDGSQIDMYEFTAKMGQEIYVQMTVPVLERLRGFTPAFMIAWVGPPAGAAAAETAMPPTWAEGVFEKGRLIAVEHRVLDALRSHGEGESEAEIEPSGPGSFEGAIALAYDGSADVVFDEPVTGTQYWTRQTGTWKAPADGTYRIAVYSPGGRAGKYVLAPGRREAFGIGDIFSLPAVRWEVRTFMEQPVWQDGLLYALLIAGVVVLGVYLVGM